MTQLTGRISLYGHRLQTSTTDISPASLSILVSTHQFSNEYL